MSYRSPNADKFVPSCVAIRTSSLDTISDLIDFFRYSFAIREESRFAMIIDDQVNQEIQSELDCRAIDLGIGLGCDYVVVRGCAKAERLLEILHYSTYKSKQL
mmetsp:Transcript_42840/g.56627  ORF Transcript_42840/g.56627 Transcript_42840/m.56627 type:complete len:103 (+) Transcript_42840:1770-2078(+)